MNRIAHLVVRLASRLVPVSLRQQWHDEWCGELAATNGRGRWRRLLGAPRDALAYRRFHAYRLARSSAGGQAWRADLRQTCRQLWRSPGYVAVVVTGLSLGIIATLAVVSLISTARWGDPAGVENRSSLRALTVREERDGFAPSTIVAFSTDAVRRVEARLPAAFSSLGAQQLRRVTVRTDGRFSSTLGAYVSGGYFETLGTRPAVGRLLTTSDDRHDSAAAVISHAVWQEMFGGRMDVVGKHVTLRDRTFEVVGVAPPGFSGRFDPPTPGHDLRSRIWLPLATAPPDPSFRDSPSLIVTLRLASSSSEPVQPALDAVGALLAEPTPEARLVRPMLRPVGSMMAETDVWEFAGMSAVLLAGPLSILAIACANVANMRLARGASRLRELSVRAALGAGTRQLIRLLAMESCILTALVLMASWLGTRAALTTMSSAIGFEVQPDARAAVAAACLGIASLVAAGLLPAWLIVRRSGLHGLRHSTHAGSAGQSRLRNSLVVVQVAASLVLVTVTGLSAQSLRTVAAKQAPVLSELALADFDFASEGLTPSQASAFTANVVARLANDPSIEAIGMSGSSLFSAGMVRYAPADAAESPPRTAGLTEVTEDWFRAMDIRLRAGRFLRATDGREAVVIDEAVAAALAPGGVAVGRTLTLQSPGAQSQTAAEAVQIVGIISAPPPDPGYERRAGSILRILDPKPRSFLALFVRSLQPEVAARHIHDIVASEGSVGPWTVIEPATERIKLTTAPLRAVAMISGSLALIGVVLSAIGLAGLTAYVVSLRHREIGVRVALGGRSKDVVGMILRQSARLTALGVVAGVLLAIPAGMLLSDGFIGVSPFAVSTLAPPVLILAAVCFVAAGVPALRAARVNPIEVLRQD